MKIFFLILIYLNSATANNFENIICGKEILEQFTGNFEEVENLCVFNEINSTADYDNIFLKMQNSYQFYFDKCQYIHYGHTCERVRNAWNTYTNLQFINSHLKKLSVNDYSLLSHILTLSASNVGLQELNREDFKPYKELLKIDLSQNNLTNLGNMVFRHLESLKYLNLSMNKIQSIHISSFDECSQTLEVIDLSFNKLTDFPVNILDALTVKNLQLHLQHNQIDFMVVPILNKDIRLNTLDISNNKIKKFHFNCTEIETLWLNDNQLQEFWTPNCSIQNLYLSNNQLQELKIRKASSLFLSPNIRLKKLVIDDVSELNYFEASNLIPNVITMAMLKNATQLVDLDLSGTFIGPLAFETFADMTLLETLKLRNTGISRLDYGMLSHQKDLKVLDISYNQLGLIDLHVMTNLKFLDTLDISGNNLTQLLHYESIKMIFPNLKIIGIDQNKFNCTYLAMILKLLNEKEIILKEPENPVKTSSNIFGIACTAESFLKVKAIEDSSDVIASKLNEIIERINNDKANYESEKFDNDLVKSELFHVRNEILDIKTQMIKNQFSHSTSINGSIDMGEVKKSIEIVNNLTLEKQKMSIDQVLHKLNELQLEVARVKMENEKSSKNLVINSPRSSNDDIRHNTSDVLLTIVITTLVIAAIVFIYTKVKDIVKQHSQQDLCVRARSTNTINTTVEMPFDDRHH